MVAALAPPPPEPAPTGGGAATADAGEGSLATRPLTALIEEGAQQQLCSGLLLLRVRLATDEVASLQEPPPRFFLVPRLAYLPFLFNAVSEHFKSCLAPRMGQSYEIWFDYNDVALRWHYPVGVLCDALVGQQVPVPLDLTVHFRGSSSKPELPPFAGVGDLQRSVMSAFRQAVFLQQGCTGPFSKFPKNDQTQLWEAITRFGSPCASQDALTASYLKQSHKQYFAVQRQLLCQNLERCKSLAVRLHFYGPPHEVLLLPAAALDEDGAPRTVGQLLQQAMPSLLVSADSKQLVEGADVLTQGVRIPLDAPLYWLALHASYLDQFVHLAVRVPPDFLHEGPSSGPSAGTG